MHETDSRHSPFNFTADRAAAPADLQSLLDDNESLPFRRRGYERESFLKELVIRAGYKMPTVDTLAPLPIEVPMLPKAFLVRDEPFGQLKTLLLQPVQSRPSLQSRPSI